MVSDIIHQTIGICINEVIAAFKILVYDLIVKPHHMQVTQIQHTGADVRWLIVQKLLLKHLNEMQTIYASAVFELYLTEPFDGSVMICIQLELYPVVVLLTCLTEYDVNEKFEKTLWKLFVASFLLLL